MNCSVFTKCFARHKSVWVALTVSSVMFTVLNGSYAVAQSQTLNPNSYYVLESGVIETLLPKLLATDVIDAELVDTDTYISAAQAVLDNSQSDKAAVAAPADESADDVPVSGDPALAAEIARLEQQLTSENNQLINRKQAAEELISNVQTHSEAFSAELAKRLAMVSDVRFPNRSTLEAAIKFALKDPVTLDQQQERIQQYDGFIAGIMQEVKVYNAASVSRSSIDWEFKGCGCEVEETKLIYGFYPSWLMNELQDGKQVIDFRYYDHVAYYGLTLDENGEIGADENWKEGALLNDFILGAHTHMTHIDLAIYTDKWMQWDERKITSALDKIMLKLSIPLRNKWESVASWFRPAWPLYSETIGRDYMGDGLTLYFADVPELSDDVIVGGLKNIVSLVQRLWREQGNAQTRVPVNIMLDVSNNRVRAQKIFKGLEQILTGPDDASDHYVDRIFVFLEQDSWQNSDQLRSIVRGVYGINAASVLEKVNPVLIPSRDRQDQYENLTNDLKDLYWTFGENGGSGIWPIPLIRLGEDQKIIAAIEKAVHNEDAVDFGALSDRWSGMVAHSREVYFPMRLWLIFLFSMLHVLCLLVLLWSIYYPISAGVRNLAKWYIIGSAIVAIIAWATRFDPFISNFRYLYFILVPLVYLLANSVKTGVADVVNVINGIFKPKAPK